MRTKRVVGLLSLLAAVVAAAAEANAVSGRVDGESVTGDDGYVARIEESLDGQMTGTVEMPANSLHRRLEPYWNFTLDGKPHTIAFRLLNPEAGASVVLQDMLLLDATDTE